MPSLSFFRFRLGSVSRLAAMLLMPDAAIFQVSLMLPPLLLTERHFSRHSFFATYITYAVDGYATPFRHAAAATITPYDIATDDDCCAAAAIFRRSFS